MTFEDGQHYVADKVTTEDKEAVCNGILSVIRCSDQKELQSTGEWIELPKWSAE